MAGGVAMGSLATEETRGCAFLKLCPRGTDPTLAL